MRKAVSAAASTRAKVLVHLQCCNMGAEIDIPRYDHAILQSIPPLACKQSCSGSSAPAMSFSWPSWPPDWTAIAQQFHHVLPAHYPNKGQGHRRTCSAASVSPYTAEIMSGPFSTSRVAPASWAAALTSWDLPVPGGPHSRTPHGGLKPNLANRCGACRHHRT